MITKDNSSLSSMATDQLLDLFSLEETTTEDDPKSGGKGVKALLETLPELWDESQYTSEYNLEA